MADNNKIQDSSFVEEGTNRETTFLKNTDEENLSVRNHYLFTKLKNSPANVIRLLTMSTKKYCHLLLVNLFVWV